MILAQLFAGNILLHLNKKKYLRKQHKTQVPVLQEQFIKRSCYLDDRCAVYVSVYLLGCSCHVGDSI